MRLNKLLICGFILSLAGQAVLTAAEEQSADKLDNQQTETKVKENQLQASKIEETVLGMNVSGNKESPNVLYIIPWKGNTSPGKLPEISRLVDEVFAPVDPIVFGKQVKFYQQLTESSDSKDKAE